MELDWRWWIKNWNKLQSVTFIFSSLTWRIHLRLLWYTRSRSPVGLLQFLLLDQYHLYIVNYSQLVHPFSPHFRWRQRQSQHARNKEKIHRNKKKRKKLTLTQTNWMSFKKRHKNAPKMASSHLFTQSIRHSQLATDVTRQNHKWAQWVLQATAVTYRYNCLLFGGWKSCSISTLY